MHGERNGAARPGERIGPYTVFARLGGGRLGPVYLAGSADGATVAVRTLPPPPAGEPVPSRSPSSEDPAPSPDRRRFVHEVALVRRVSGPFVAGVVDADPEADVPWLASEYVPAPSLGELVTAHGPLPAPGVCWIAAGMVEALLSVHAAELVHQEVSPSNVLLPEDGPRLVDIGSSQAAHLSQASTGTLAFAAPEQARGEPATTATDVFALGATWFHLATGRSPYGALAPDTALDQVARATDGDLHLDGLPAELDALIRPCLAVDPSERPTPRALSERVGPLVAERPSASGATDWLPASWSTAIAQHHRRRAGEIDAAQRSFFPEMATEAPQPPPSTPPPPDGAKPPYSPPGMAPPAMAPAAPPYGPPPAAVRRRRTGLWIGVIVAVVGLIAAGTVLLLNNGGDDDSDAAAGKSGGQAPRPVRQDLLLSLVEQSAEGSCTGAMPPPAYTDAKQETCYGVSERAEDTMVVKQLDEVESTYSQQSNQWLVQITFQEADGKRFAELSQRAAKRAVPQNQIAIVLGDRLLSAPTVVQMIPGGEIEISGSFTRESAEDLARDLGAR